MKLPEEGFEEFKEVWEKEYGEKISLEQAREYGESLLGFFQILMDIDQGKK